MTDRFWISMSVMLEIPLQSLLGENEKCVDQAIKMLRVEYEVLPANLDPRKAMDKDTPLVHQKITGKHYVILVQIIRKTCVQQKKHTKEMSMRY